MSSLFGIIDPETIWTTACLAYACAVCVVLRTKACLCVVDRFASERDVGTEAALLVAQVVRAKPNARVLFLTGSTPIRSGFFATLKELHDKAAVDFSKMRVVGGDEYAGVPMTEPGSFALYLRNHIIKPLGCDDNKALLLDGGAPDQIAECRRYEESLVAEGGQLDLCILGLGLNGHVAFNDPPSEYDSVTRVVKLTPESIATSKGDLTYRSTAQLPTHALSIGIASIIRHSTNVCVLVTGKSKQNIMLRVLRGAVSAAVPASFLRMSPHVRFMLDEDAAALL